VAVQHPDAPKILREGNRSVFDQREQKRTRHKGIREIPRNLILELAAKEA
jgi:hypothetical protein